METMCFGMSSCLVPMTLRIFHKYGTTYPSFNTWKFSEQDSGETGQVGDCLGT